MNPRFAIPNTALVLALTLMSCKSAPPRYIVTTAPPLAEAVKPSPDPKPALEPASVEQPVASPNAPINTLGSAPPRGTPTEYDQMVEALRAAMVVMHGAMDMTARSIHRLGDWAWLEGQPHDPGTRSESVDPVGALMQRIDGSWQLVTIACGEDSDTCEEGWKRFPKDYPHAPVAIFPNASARVKTPAAMLTAQLGGTHLTLPLEDLARKVKLAPGEVFKIEEVGRDAHSSQHIVALLDREPLHRHDTHDLLVVVLEGEGEMLIGTETRPIGPHSIVYVPRHTVHSMHNTQKEPLIGYAIFTPPFDGKDRVPVAQP